MKKLAEELGVKDLPQRVSPVMMQHLGFKDLREPGRIEVDVRENEPAAIWLGDGEKEQSWLLVTPIRRRGVVPEWTLRVQVLKLGKGSWSLSEQTSGDLMKDSRPVHTQGLGDGQHVEVFSEPIPKERKYRLTLRRTGAQASR